MGEFIGLRKTKVEIIEYYRTVGGKISAYLFSNCSHNIVLVIHANLDNKIQYCSFPKNGQAKGASKLSELTTLRPSRTW